MTEYTEKVYLVLFFVSTIGQHTSIEISKWLRIRGIKNILSLYYNNIVDFPKSSLGQTPSTIHIIVI